MSYNQSKSDTGMPGSVIDEESVELDSSLASQEVWDRNTRLRRQYLQACADIKQATTPDEQRRAELAREAAADEFVRSNRALIGASARPFLKGEHREDIEASALVGLWEAFVGTNAQTAGEVEVDEDGNVIALAGWDPSTSTFGTWSRSHISGRAARSVAVWDEKFHGVSYSTFQKAPAVHNARAELRAALGSEPSVELIAARAEVTEATVRNVLAGAPVSLSTPVFDDESATMEDMLAESLQVDVVLNAGQPQVLAAVAAQEPRVKIVDLMIAALRLGLTGRPPLTVNRAADALGVGRGVVINATKRFEKALRATAR